MNGPCLEFQSQIEELVSGVTQTDRSEKLQEHISRCPACSRYHQELLADEQLLVEFCKTMGSSVCRVENGVIEAIELPKSMAQSVSRVENGVIEAINRRPSGRASRSVWIRNILWKGKMTKMAAAAAVLLAIVLVGLLIKQRTASDETFSTNGFSLLSKACAAEGSLFAKYAIVHMTNEIIVRPRDDSGMPDNSFRTGNVWVDQQWLPLCSLKADGEMRFNQLKLPARSDRQYSITDECWYDSQSGRFARIMRTKEGIIFANSFDGKFVYTTEPGEGGSMKLVKEAIKDGFSPPKNPAAFLGISAGVQSNLQKEPDPLVEDLGQGNLADGKPVRVYRLGYQNLYGQFSTYWLVKVSSEDGIIAEMEFILAGKSRLLIHRLGYEQADSSRLHWDLSGVLTAQNPQEVPLASVKPDMVIPNVSVGHMVEKADFETYIFKNNPSWTSHREITDCEDLPSPGHRMFSITYRADNGRHVVLVQSHTYNSTLGQFAKQGQLVYTSPNGFKVWRGGPEKWYTDIILRSARAVTKQPPADDRTGYVLESPAGCFPTLAINGVLTDGELHTLIDSLIPASEYQKSSKGGPNE